MNFGDLVEYNGKQYRYVGMDEDGAELIVRGIDEHAFGILEFETIWHDDFQKIKLIKKSTIKNPFPDTIPYESFTDKFCREKGISKEEFHEEMEEFKKYEEEKTGIKRLNKKPEELFE